MCLWIYATLTNNIFSELKLKKSNRKARQEERPVRPSSIFQTITLFHIAIYQESKIFHPFKVNSKSCKYVLN